MRPNAATRVSIHSHRAAPESQFGAVAIARPLNRLSPFLSLLWSCSPENEGKLLCGRLRGQQLTWRLVFMTYLVAAVNYTCGFCSSCIEETLCHFVCPDD